MDLGASTTIRELGGISARVLRVYVGYDRIMYYRGGDSLIAYSHLVREYFTQIRNS